MKHPMKHPMIHSLFRIFVIFLFITAVSMPAAAKYNGLIDSAALNRVIKPSQSKIVGLNFWATWCGPCRLEMPHLMRLRTDFSTEDLTLISVSGDSNDRAVESFHKKMQLNFPVYRADDDVPATYSVVGVPKTMIFNKKGLVFEHMGYLSKKTLERIINAELKKEE
jgi:thiol-disulfide isomerase/thioredoxin